MKEVCYHVVMGTETVEEVKDLEILALCWQRIKKKV